MAKALFKSIRTCKNANNFKSCRRIINYGELADALEKEDNTTIVAFFLQDKNYVPTKEPGFLESILGTQGLTKLREKYLLWKKGALK